MVSEHKMQKRNRMEIEQATVNCPSSPLTSEREPILTGKAKIAADEWAPVDDAAGHCLTELEQHRLTVCAEFIKNCFMTIKQTSPKSRNIQNISSGHTRIKIKINNNS